MARAYAGTGDVRDPALSPVFADLRGLPALLVQASEADEFAPDALAHNLALVETVTDVAASYGATPGQVRDQVRARLDLAVARVRLPAA